MELHRELLRRLNLDGSTAELLPDHTGIRITVWAGTQLDPPLVLECTPAQLGTRIRDLGSTAFEALGGSDPVIAAMQLLIVHVEEAIASRTTESHRLVITSSGVRAAH